MEKSNGALTFEIKTTQSHCLIPGCSWSHQNSSNHASLPALTLRASARVPVHQNVPAVQRGESYSTWAALCPLKTWEFLPPSSSISLGVPGKDRLPAGGQRHAQGHQDAPSGLSTQCEPPMMAGLSTAAGAV